MGKKKKKKNKAEIAAYIPQTPSKKIVYEEGYIDGTKTVLYRYNGKLKMAGSVKMRDGRTCEFESLPIEFIHDLIEKHYRENQEQYLKIEKVYDDNEYLSYMKEDVNDLFGDDEDF